MPQFLEVHIENTNSCRYRCVMCPRDQHTRALGYMSIEDFTLTLQRLGSFDGHFHLHGFGEPLLDRKLAQKVKILKTHFPNSKAHIFSTLGVRLQEDTFNQLADAGLDSIGVSLYGYTPQSYQAVHGYDGFALVKKNLQALSIAMQRPQSHLHTTIKLASDNIASTLPIASLDKQPAFTDWLQGLGFSILPWGYVHNYGDGRTYNAPNPDKLCPVLNGMRKYILNITWDLNVIPCCYDFNASIIFGNLRTQTLEEIFDSPEYLRFCLAHFTKDLSSYPVCQNCEKNDYS